MEQAINRYLTSHGFGQFCPKAVLFDMDGVIYDSMPNHAVSWHDSMATFGLEMPYDGAYRYEGMRGVETIKQLARQQWGRELSDEEAHRMYEVKSAYFNRQPAPQLMEGIRTLMQQIKADGLKICLVTGSGQHTLLDKILADLHGLLTPELMVTAFDVTHGKPAPDPYLKGMQKCGVEPWEAIVVENAPLGVRAAVAAQCFTVAVNTGPLPDAELADEGANLILPSILQLSRSWNSLVEAVRNA
ncbi:MAG: HAD-IA family hydrolase [Prevotella sp.]|nr:HAD-IA family hydrolase [Prevotella sp.]